MTDVTVSTSAGGDALDAVDEQLIRQLADRARAEGLQLTGEGGLLTRLTKTVIESALEGELNDHLGYDKHDPAGRNGANSRNGGAARRCSPRSVRSRSTVPRDRDGSFEPRIVPQASAAAVRGGGPGDLAVGEGVDHRGDPRALGRGVRRAGVARRRSRRSPTRCWRGWPSGSPGRWTRVYPVLFIDAIIVKVRDGNVANRPIYVALAVTVDGDPGHSRACGPVSTGRGGRQVLIVRSRVSGAASCGEGEGGRFVSDEG